MEGYLGGGDGREGGVESSTVHYLRVVVMVKWCVVVMVKWCVVVMVKWCVVVMVK